MGKLIVGLVSLPIAGTIIHFIITAILAGLLAMTYTSLTQEKLVATITFDKVDNQAQKYMAHLKSFDDSEIGDYVIYGDQWRMDASFTKMEYWANILGIDSKYALNRFEGRYKDINEQNTKEHKSYELEGHSLVEKFSFFFDTNYGSSVYQDIKLNTKYRVLKTQTGLMVRNEPFFKKKEKSMMDRTKALFGY